MIDLIARDRERVIPAGGTQTSGHVRTSKDGSDLLPQLALCSSAHVGASPP